MAAEDLDRRCDDYGWDVGVASELRPLSYGELMISVLSSRVAVKTVTAVMKLQQ
ncbi:hypothetical protein TIFTF001_029631 [Ficus carica]|uniref:Uncharacterized protein n=1 Tax=Ficus carica TaxID=3494 RepID=A0AA88DS69_FICCA|nr:hypothetical protein TIFTF001_029631 [Ficus carica]